MPEEERLAHIRLLAAECVSLVEQMRQERYEDDHEWQQLSSERSLVHDELIGLTGLTERKAMYAYCRELLSAAGSA